MVLVRVVAVARTVLGVRWRAIVLLIVIVLTIVVVAVSRLRERVSANVLDLWRLD